MGAPSALVDGKKLCPRCSTWKPLDEYHKAPKRPHGVRPLCRPCVNADNKARAERDPEKTRAAGRVRANRWYAKNPEHARQLHRLAHAEATPEAQAKRRARGRKHKTKWRADNRALYRELSRVATKKWSEAHPEKARECDRKNASNRRAWKRDLGEPISGVQWSSVVACFGGVCAYCKQPKRLGMDHFVPLAAGGRHRISNVVPCCRNCNSSKRDSDPFEWMESHGIDSDLIVSLICETRRISASDLPKGQ